MKKPLFILLFVLSGCQYAFSSYSATYLPELIETSDIILHGKIISVDETTFRVVIIKNIKAITKPDTLTILKFINWTCAARYAKYEVGQEGIYFLIFNKDKQLEPLGAANEGELVVRGKTTYIRSYIDEKYKSKAFNFISEYEKFIPLHLETVIGGIRLYLDNLEGINKELDRPSPGTVVYQYSYIDRLPANEFLTVVIDQRRTGFR